MYRGLVLTAAAQGLSPSLGPFAALHPPGHLSSFLSSLKPSYQSPKHISDKKRKLYAVMKSEEYFLLISGPN